MNTIASRALLSLLLAGAPAAALASEQLAQRHACVACHQANTKTVGPSWSDIRAKYKDGSATAPQLARNIKAGSTGKWGPVPMPPQAAVPDADAATLAGWILTGN